MEIDQQFIDYNKYFELCNIETVYGYKIKKIDNHDLYQLSYKKIVTSFIDFKTIHNIQKTFFEKILLNNKELDREHRIIKPFFYLPKILTFDNLLRINTLIFIFDDVLYCRPYCVIYSFIDLYALTDFFKLIITK